MTAPKALMRRAGPLPVWAWIVLALAGAYVVHRHSGSAQAAQATAVPVGATTTGMGTGATGSSSSPLDNSSGDLLSSLLGNQNAYEQLLSALQLGDVGVGTAGAPGGSGGGSSGVVPESSATTTAATPPAPGLISGADIIASDPYYAGRLDPNTLYRNLGNDLTNLQGPVSSPTPTLVQPAPVDSGVGTQQVRPGGATVAA